MSTETPRSDRGDPHELLDELLPAAVRQATGRSDVEPRPGQAQLSHEVLDRMLAVGQPSRSASDVATQSLAGAPTGSGKALALDTPVPTPTGWTTMGEIEVGDFVFDASGRPTRVTAVSEVQTEHDCYEVTFSEGSTIVADAEHLWPSWTRKTRFAMAEVRRHNKNPRLGDVEQLVALRKKLDINPLMPIPELVGMAPGALHRDLVIQKRRAMGFPAAAGGPIDARPVVDAFIEQRTGRGGGYEVMTTRHMTETLTTEDDAKNHSVIVAGALDLPSKDLSLSPYVLGAWLGDGNSIRGTIASGSDDADDMYGLLTQEWPGWIRVGRDSAGNMRLALREPHHDLCPWGHPERKRIARQTVCAHCSDHKSWERTRQHYGLQRWNTGLTARLRRMGLLSNKHIPMEYLRASFEQRVALLQGLMDTDGTSIRSGGYEFCVTSEALAEGFRELVTSLGIQSKMYATSAAVTRADGDRVECGVRYRITFSTGLTVFRLPRKLKAQADKPAAQRSPLNDFRYVTDIKPAASVPVRCIVVESDSHLFLAGEAMIPTHNSLAYLSPLLLDVALNGHRGVVSTESLSLQSQIVDKDAPAVAEAIKTVVPGADPSFAILKGWSNYGCAYRAVGAAAQVLGVPEDGQDPSTLPTLAASLDAWSRRNAGDEDVVVVDDQEFEASRLVPLTRWVLESATDPDGVGDRDTYPGRREPEDWRAVSVSTDDCVGVDSCPFSTVCLPKEAQRKASQADVVVTNHAMLAVQAANNVPVVLGSPRLGMFDHIVIDEAHALPGIVRGAGARSVSAPRVMGLVKLLHRHCATEQGRHSNEELDREAEQLTVTGEGLAVRLDKALDALVMPVRRRGGHGAAVKGLTAEDEEPIGDLGDQLRKWSKAVLKALPVDNPSAPLPPTQAIKLRRARADATRFGQDLEAVLTHEVGHARWVADGDPTRAGRWVGASLRSSPVDVSGDIATNLFTSEVVRDAEHRSEPWGQMPGHRWVSDEDQAGKRAPRYRLSATAVSATLPKTFAFDTGMAVKAREYPSPFLDAYAASALYVPVVTDPAEAAAFTRTWPGASRPSFDTARHPEWAVGQVVELVRANGGRALVLAATVNAGKQYAETLRVILPGLRVFSQWDGLPVRHVLASWRVDETSVMVGTKSLMTGVDAPGQTCSLVILDRVPRDAGNPVDDARVEAVMERAGLDKWAADRHVYVADAALRMDQAEGRMIRAATDVGMVAVLDPRLLKQGVVKYGEPTRKLLMEPLSRYGTKMVRLPQALEWLRAHRNSADAKVA